MTPAAVREAAFSRDALVREVRRDLHRIPELAMAEHRTTDYVESFLEKRGVAFERSPSGTGGVAVVGEGAGGVLLRADLDGLPVGEDTGLPFTSENPGCMHACGHDGHTAMLLAAADALASGAVAPPGRVVLVFQPAEEGYGGAARLLKEGLLERHPVGAAVALHLWPGLPVGRLGISPGPLMASMDRLRLVFLGRGGHGALPHQCVDPVVMAAEGVLAFQSLVSRATDPLAPAVLTVGAIRGGTAPNIIPDEVELLATVRAFEPGVRDALLGGLRRVGDGVAAAHGGRFRWVVEETYPVTRNDPEVTARLGEGIRSVLGAEAVVSAEPTMGAEDMGMILSRVPGCYVRLGCATDPATAAPLHSARFSPDEACLCLGVAVHLEAALTLPAP